VSAVFFFPARNLAADLERVPNVVGEPEEEARTGIEDHGLVYEQGTVFYHEAAKGTVIAQDPLPGQMTRPGSTVSVTVSLGPRMGAVPDVIGLAHEQAELVVEGAGYASELIWVDDETPRGQVVSTRPAPGTPIELSGEIKLVVSAGPPLVQVPELSSRTLADVRETLERLGLRLGSVTESAAGGTPGTVLAQEPAAGTEVARGTAITVTVAASDGARARDTIPPAEERGEGR
jgi:serine/threonine-protein kinase